MGYPADMENLRWLHCSSANSGTISVLDSAQHQKEHCFCSRVVAPRNGCLVISPGPPSRSAISDTHRLGKANLISMVTLSTGYQ